MAKKKVSPKVQVAQPNPVRSFEVRIIVEGSRLVLQYVNNPTVFESLGAVKTAEALIEATLMEGRGK